MSRNAPPKETLKGSVAWHPKNSCVGASVASEQPKLSKAVNRTVSTDSWRMKTTNLFSGIGIENGTIPTECLIKLDDLAILSCHSCHSSWLGLQDKIVKMSLVTFTLLFGEWNHFSVVLLVSLLRFVAHKKKQVLINSWYGPCEHAGIDFQVIHRRIGLRKDGYPKFLSKIIFIWTFLLPFAMQ